MKLRLEATDEELLEKGTQLVDALAQSIEVANPELAKSLRSAVRDEPTLKYPVLRGLHKETADVYAQQMAKMLGEINRVIDGKPLTKSLDTPKIDPESVGLRVARDGEYACGGCARFTAPVGRSALGRCELVAGNIHPKKDTCDLFESPSLLDELGELLDDAGLKVTIRPELLKGNIEKAEDEEPPEPGDLTDDGEVVPDPPTPEEKEEAAEEKELDKAIDLEDRFNKLYARRPDLKVKRQPVFDDHTQAIYDKDEETYGKAHAAALKAGFTKKDFAVGGSLRDLSTNQLNAEVRRKRIEADQGV